MPDEYVFCCIGSLVQKNSTNMMSSMYDCFGVHSLCVVIRILKSINSVRFFLGKVVQLNLDTCSKKSTQQCHGVD